jgi:hypothetical protein
VVETLLYEKEVKGEDERRGGEGRMGSGGQGKGKAENGRKKGEEGEERYTLQKLGSSSG